MSLIGDAKQGLQNVGAVISHAGKAAGKVVSDYNPYKKGPTYKAQNVADAQVVTAPAFDINNYRGPGAVAGPTSFQGSHIGGVADPRQVLIDQSQQAEFRSGQQNLAGQLAMQAQGQGPSLATEQLNQAQKANQQAAFAQLASQRGGPNAGNARATQQASAAIQGQTARDAASARIQEQMAARQQLAGVLDSARGQDISMATNQANLQQQAALEQYKGNLQKAIAQGQLDQATASQMFQAATQNAQQNAQMSSTANAQYNDLVARYGGMGMDAQRANQMAAMQIDQQRRAEQSQAFQSNAAASAAQKQAIGSTIGSVASFAMGGGMQGMLGGGGGGGGGVSGVGASGTPLATAEPNQPAPAPSGYEDPNSINYKGY